MIKIGLFGVALLCLGFNAYMIDGSKNFLLVGIQGVMFGLALGSAAANVYKVLK